MGFAELRERLDQIEESVDVGRDVSPSSIRFLIGTIRVLLADIEQMRGEAPAGYEPFDASRFAQELVATLRDSEAALSQAWAVAKNPAKNRIDTARQAVRSSLKVLASGVKFALMTRKDPPHDR